MPTENTASRYHIGLVYEAVEYRFRKERPSYRLPIWQKCKSDFYFQKILDVCDEFDISPDEYLDTIAPQINWGMPYLLPMHLGSDNIIEYARAILQDTEAESNERKILTRVKPDGTVERKDVSVVAYELSMAIKTIKDRVLNTSQSDSLTPKDISKVVQQPWNRFDPVAAMLFAGNMPEVGHRYGEDAARILRQDNRIRNAAVELGLERAVKWIGEQYGN